MLHFYVKSTWKATKTIDSTQIFHFDLVFHRVQREGQLGISYIFVVFGGAHVCLVVHVCVYCACKHTYVWSFVLYDFIKSNTILPGFHWNQQDFMKSTAFHRISLKSTGLHYGFHCGFHSCEICNETHNEIRKWNPQWKSIMKSCWYQ